LNQACDHVIAVGKVEKAIFDSRGDHLLYFPGKYLWLHFTRRRDEPST